MGELLATDEKGSRISICCRISAAQHSDSISRLRPTNDSCIATFQGIQQCSSSISGKRIVDYVEVGATELLAAVREQQREGIIGK